MANSKLTALAQRFRELKDLKDRLNDELKGCNDELGKLESELLPQAMDENEIEKFTVDGVGTIFTQMKVYAYVKKEHEAEFHDWLRAEGHGDLIKPYVHPATLSSFAKEQLEAGVDLPDWFTAAKKETAMLRRK